jgi:hypothetical protein
MENLPMKTFAHSLVLAVLAGVGACTVETPPEGRSELRAPARDRVPTYSDWSLASDIEQAPPGAHSNFNTTTFLEGCPFIAPDDKTFFIASNRPGGKGGLDIWMSTRASVDEPWGEPVNVGEPVNSASDDFCPTIARDMHTFYFASRRQVGEQGVDWCGGSDLYVTRRRDDGSFEPPRNLGCDVNSSADEFSPFPLEERASGPVLYFSSTRPGYGTGGNLYRSESHGGVFGTAELVPNVNSMVDDGQPNLSRDGLELYFYSARKDLPGAQGGNDIYVATRTASSDPWSTPINLGPAVNRGASETRPSLSWDGTTLYFGSIRAGSSDIYVTTRRRINGR